MTASPAKAPALRSVTAPRRLATARVVTALMLREMTSSYGRSPGGFLWVVLEPLAGIVLLSAVFSVALRSPQLGTNFVLFYASGILPFLLFAHLNAKLMHALAYSRQLLAYPRVTIVDALLARFALNLIVELLNAALLLTGMIWLLDTGADVELGPILLGFAMAAALALGVGVLNCFLGSMFPLWRSVWAVLSRPLVLLSGVIILVETVPEPWRGWLWWNPLAHAVTEVRRGLYHGYDPSWVEPAYAFAVALAALAAGLLFLWRTHRDILEK
jgi:capsular polysaccharide transport system permease protein